VFPFEDTKGVPVRSDRNLVEKSLGMSRGIGKVAALQNDEKQFSRPKAIV
jgi:hypothetical protein